MRLQHSRSAPHNRTRLPLLVSLFIAAAFGNGFGDGVHRPIVIGSEADYPPFSFLSAAGNPSGFNIDLIRAVAEEIEMDVEIRLAPWNEIREDLASGEIDAIAGMFYSVERDREVDFSQGYVSMHQMLFVRAGDPVPRVVEELAESELLVIQDDILHDYFRRSGLSLEFRTAATLPEALQRFSAGEGDYLAGPLIPTLYQIRSLRLDGIEQGIEVGDPLQYCFAVREGDRELLTHLIEGLGVLRQNGEYQQIRSRWLGTLDTEILTPAEALRYALFVLVPLAVVAAAVLIWAAATRRLIARRTLELQDEVGRRAAAEEHLRRVNGLLEAVSRINQLIVRAVDRDAMLTQVCRLLAKARGYYNAWIVLLDRYGGYEASYNSGLGGEFDALQRYLEEGELPACCRGALESGELTVTDNPETVCPACPLVDNQPRYSAVTVPLRHSGRLFGLLTVSLPREYRREKTEEELLRGIGDDIGFALQTLELRREREQIENSLHMATTIVRNSRIVLVRRENRPGLPVSYISENVRRFGYEAEQFLEGGLGYGDIIDPDDRDAVDYGIEEALRKDEEYLIQEYGILGPDGRRRLVEDRTRVLRGEDGEVTALEGIVIDITERKRDEEELRFQSMLLNQISDRVTATDMEGRITYVNEAECRFFGMERDDLVGRFVEEYGEDSSRGATQAEIIRQVRRDGEFTGDIVNYGRDGTEMIVRSRIQLMKDQDGKPVGMVGIGTDVTGLREAESMILQQDAQLRAIIESAEDSIYIKNRRLRYTHVNSAFLDFLGLPAEKVLGASDAELLDEVEAEENRRIDGRVLAGESWRGESVHLVDGTEVRTDTIKVPVRDEHGTVSGICAISRDISVSAAVRRRLEEALEEKNVLLRELYHRTKNNMQVIAAMVALRRFGIDDPGQQELLREIEGRIHSMALVHKRLYQTRDLSRLDLKLYLEELVDLIRDGFEEKAAGVGFRLDLEPVEGLIDTAVPLGLAVNELLLNALKHAFPDGRRGVIEIRLRRRDPDGAELIVADDGVGFPEDFDERRPDTLGIQTVENLVRGQLNGEIELLNGSGTRWRIVFGDGSYRERV